MSTLKAIYDTPIFTDIYSDAESFVSDYTSLPIETTISVDEAKLLYYLLYAKYGNTPIANDDVNQFKYKLFATVWQYGPTWSKKLFIQKKLRELTDDEIFKGSQAIYNTALNPQDEPSDTSLEELTYINQQQVTNYRKSKIEGYGNLWSMLVNDVTKEFISKFSICFKKFANPSRPLLFCTEEDGNE